MTTLLSVKGLSRRFGGLKAVNNVSFSVGRGSIKAVIGPNGAGKTTLFNLISGFLPSDSGTVEFEDKSLTGLKPHAVARRGVARTFQTTRLFPKMTALENVMVGRHTQSRAGYIAAMLALPGARRQERAIEKRAMELLDFTGIADLAGADATSLAFGSQRAVELARALALEPSLLLLDEPAAGLNMQETRQIAALIGRIRELGVTVLIVEHDMSLVMDISDEIIVLSYGEKIAEGTPMEIQKDPEVVRVYLGSEDDA